MTPASTVLCHATIVRHDRVVDEPLAFAGGRVAAGASVGAYRVELRDHLVLPGLINAHDHLQLNGVPPLPHAEPFANSYAWIAAFAAHRERPEVAAAVSMPKSVRHWHGALKNVVAGATTVAHHDPRHGALDEPGFPVDVPRALAWGHSLGLGESMGYGGPRYGPRLRESHAATPPGHPWVVHLAEGTDDVARAELGRLDALGCLAPNTVLVHGVGLTDADVERVIARGAAVVWCPASNLELLGRTLDARRLFDEGRLALGSDSRLTGARDLLDELRVAAAHGDLSPAELLRLVTVDACRILRLDDRGALAPGERADCLVVRAGDDPHRTLLETRRGDVRAVVRDGAPVIADPDLAGWFAHCGVETVAVELDGRPKLAARCALPTAAALLEPGLSLPLAA